MQRSASLSFDAIAPRRARPGVGGPWLGAALCLGLALGLGTPGCTFAPTGQGPGDIGPGPAADAGPPLDGRQPVDAGAAGPIDAEPAPPDAGGGGRPTLPAYPVDDDDIEIDGALDDWSNQGWITLEAPAHYRQDSDASGADAADLSMRFAARWSANDLYLAFEVTDDVHATSPGNNDQLWRGDSVQAGFDVGLNGGGSYDTTDDFEYGWALAGNGQPREFRWVQGSGAPGPATEFEVVRSGNATIYEVRMPPSNLGLATLEMGRRIGFSAIANDDDADIDIGDAIRDGWLEWTPGIAVGKLPGMFGVIELR
jgi:hypothetical protein